MNLDIILALVTAILTSVVGPIIVFYVRNFFDKKKKSENVFQDSIKANQLITEKLENIRESIDSDRVWLLQFHNGGHFYPTGKSIQKFSMVYELLKSDVFPCQYQFQNIPVSLFSKAIIYLSSGNNIVIEDVDNNKNQAFTSVVSGAGVKSTYVFPIFNIKGEFVAIVGADFVKNKVLLSEQDITNIEIETSVIGGVLMNYLQS